jgi:hypothetical protein
MINLQITGFVHIQDANTGQVLVDKRNQIHYENFSEAMAWTMSGDFSRQIRSMSFGNGGTSVDSTGVITYLPPNTNTQQSDLYNPTFSKVVNQNQEGNTDPQRNRIEVRHIPGQVFSDILISCLLDYGEPSDQAAFDNSQNLDDQYVFDELGIKSVEDKLLTHVIFHPIQKSLNRLIQIDYTIRIQTLTNLTGA